MSYTFLQLEKEMIWTYLYWLDFKKELKAIIPLLKRIGSGSQLSQKEKIKLV